jgi:UDP-N-acetylmuramate dehydrogenase
MSPSRRADCLPASTKCFERAGFHRAYGNGRVGISTNHTRALVNRGGATTAVLMALACEIAAGVHDRFGIALHPECVLVGHGW